jgi:hypothetical protein
MSASEFEETIFPSVQSDKTVICANIIDLSNPPTNFIMKYNNCECGGTFCVSKKTQEQIVQIRNCNFNKISGTW